VNDLEVEAPRLSLREMAPALARELQILGESIDLEPRLKELVNIRASMSAGRLRTISMTSGLRSILPKIAT
jgi:hypothetical protein